ncbi:hypothetical protein [Streptomyces sp. NPDC059071]|uniref:hypothetical protein n=1 Tax=unclassified Streptomyces TaxID=2593676 RepID=UPI003648CAA0
MSAWEKKIRALARRAENRTGEAELTDAVGEGLAAVAHAVLRTGFSQGPRVWLDTRTPSTTWVRREDVVSARVREEPQDGAAGFILEVFVPGLATAEKWLTVATGNSEWFELNAAEDLLTLLEKIARNEDEDLPSVFVSVHGEADGKLSLAWDRNY